MKLAVQSEGYIKRYGIEKALDKIKNVGYSCISYCIEDNYNSKMVTDWSEEELREYYSGLGEKIKYSGLELASVSVKTQMYSDWSKASFPMRKELYLKCVRACAYLGCDQLVVPLVTYHSRVADSYSQSLAIAEEMLGVILPEAEKAGVMISVVNPCVTLDVYPFGCESVELADFAKKHGVGVVLDPVNGQMSGTDASELIRACGESFMGVFVRDYEEAFQTPAIPMMGAVDYCGFIESLKDAPDKGVVVMMLTEVYHRFSDLGNQDAMYSAFDSFFYKMGKVISGGGMEK